MLKHCLWLSFAFASVSALGAIALKDGRYFLVGRVSSCEKDAARLCLVYAQGSQSERSFQLSESKWSAVLKSTEGKIDLELKIRVRGSAAEVLSRPKVHRADPLKLGDDSPGRLRFLGP